MPINAWPLDPWRDEDEPDFFRRVSVPRYPCEGCTGSASALCGDCEAANREAEAHNREVDRRGPPE